MHQVAVDIDQAGSIRLLIHQMVLPDLVVEGTRLGHLNVSNCSDGLSSVRRAQEKGAGQRPLKLRIEVVAYSLVAVSLPSASIAPCASEMRAFLPRRPRR